MKKIFKIISEWQELFLILPITLFLVLFGNKAVQHLDPTSSWLDSGTLSILFFNLLIWAVTFGAAYLFYKFSFSDRFIDGWEKQISPLAATVIHLILWLTSLGITAFILLRNI